MLEIINRNETFEREVWSRKKAEQFFKKNNENYKLEIIKEIPKKEDLTIYKQGNFLDLSLAFFLSVSPYLVLSRALKNLDLSIYAIIRLFT